MDFLHGVEVIEIDDDTHPITSVQSSVIGLVGTAPIGPVNQPVLIAGSRKEALLKFGDPNQIKSCWGYTIPAALSAIFDQIGAMVVVINVSGALKSECCTYQLTNGQVQINFYKIATGLDVKSKDEKITYKRADYTFDSRKGELVRIDSGSIPNDSANLSLNYSVEKDVTLVGGKVNLAKSITGLVVKSTDGETAYDKDKDYSFDTSTGELVIKSDGKIKSDATLTVCYSLKNEKTNLVAGKVVLGVGVSSLLVKSTDVQPKTYTTGDYILSGNTLIRVNGGKIADDSAELSLTFEIPDPDVKSCQIREGIERLIDAQSIVNVTPRILIAPDYTGKLDGSNISADDVSGELIKVANRLRAVTILEGPDSDEVADALNYRKGITDGERAYLVYPKVMVAGSDGNKVSQSPVARVAGVIAKSDNERGFWWSPSNRPMMGILGTERAIDFALGDKNSQANILNSDDIATIIHQDGYRLWGNRSCASQDNAKWQFISVRRTADLINDSLLRAHLWAVDRNISKTYIEDVLEGVNSYLRSLKSMGAIIDGSAWADPDENTSENIANGQVTFDFGLHSALSG